MKSHHPHSVILPAIEDWQSLVQLARKIEAQPAHVINSIDRGQRCQGYWLEAQKVGPQHDLHAMGLDGRTKTLYRVQAFSLERDQLTETERDLERKIAALDECGAVELAAQGRALLQDARNLRQRLTAPPSNSCGAWFWTGQTLRPLAEKIGENNGFGR